MLAFVPAHMPWNIKANVELQRSHKALRDDLVHRSATSIRNICQRQYALTVGPIKKQLLTRNNVRLALDGWTSTNKQAIMLVIAYYMHRN